MYKYFNYYDLNNINIYYCNKDSIVIKENDLYKMTNYISNYPGDFKISRVYNMGCQILSQGKYKFVGEVMILKIKFEICCKTNMQNVTKSYYFF
jgi:hypothetical protein